MIFVDKMLDNDVMNNSVWSFRYFLIMRKNKDNFSMALENMELRHTQFKLEVRKIGKTKHLGPISEAF